ncbi:MAG: hypothetical protein KF912_10435 [Phycisphaeraceae bacterium]|nr:hypothetical protein [Phycisphaeraceae bacterium]MBX3367715.1 hypothetical protein [Phycisphaeraceae bacterium]
MKLYVIRSRVNEALDEEVAWMAAIGIAQSCPTCSRPRSGLYPSPLSAEVMLRQRATVSLSGKSAIRIYKREFFDRIRNRIDWVVSGPVTRSNGRFQEGSVTVHFDPSREIPLRGGRGTTYHACPTCNKVSSEGYSRTRPWHVMANDININDGIYYIMADSLLMLSDDVIVDMNLKHDFPDLAYTPVLILDRPLDPVPELGDRVS